MSKVHEEVIADLLEREQRGIAKYGVTMDRPDLTEIDWLVHAYEEALDKLLYLKAAINARKRQAAADACVY